MSTIGQHVGRRASELLDGRLTACAEHEVRTHLGSCAPCAAIVHREQQVRATLRAAAGQAPVPRGDLMAGLMALAVAPPQPVPSHVPAPASSRRVTSRSSVLAVAVLGSVSLASAGAIGVGAVAQGGFGVVAPDRRPSAVQGALTDSGFASTASVVQPAVAVLRGAATTTSHTGIRWVDAGAASQP